MDRVSNEGGSPSDREGTEGMQPPAPARLDDDEEYAKLILQLRTCIVLNQAARARESMAVFRNYASPQDLADEVAERDLLWFDAHPGVLRRVRRAVEGEFLGLEALLPPFEFVEVTLLPGRRTACRPLLQLDEASLPLFPSN